MTIGGMEGNYRYNKDGSYDRRYTIGKKLESARRGDTLINKDVRVKKKKKDRGGWVGFMGFLAFCYLGIGFIMFIDGATFPHKQVLSYDEKTFGKTTILETHELVITTERETPLEVSFEHCEGYIESLICQDKYDWDSEVMVAVAKAENGYNMHGGVWVYDAYLDEWNGTVSRGIFQINSVHGYSAEVLNNPEANIEIAYSIWKTQGVLAWGAFSNSSYLNYLN